MIITNKVTLKTALKNNGYNATSGYGNTQYISQRTTLKWRVLTVNNENSTVDITVSNDTAVARIYFKGDSGYNNAVYILNDVAKKLYSNSNLGITARSINMKDIEKHLKSGITRKTLNSNYGSFAQSTNGSYYPNLYAEENGSGVNTTNVKENGIEESEQYSTVSRVF